MPARKRARKEDKCCACGEGACSDESILPLCEPCLVRTEEVAETEWFRGAYSCPGILFEIQGPRLSSMLSSLLLPAPLAALQPTLVSAKEALDEINGDLTASLLILTGAGTSVEYGVSPGYGPPYEEATPVNEKYWTVFLQGRLARTTTGSGFHSRLREFVTAQVATRPNVCVATSNIDGLCPVDLGPGVSLLELHGSVTRAQCSARSTAACKSALSQTQEPKDLDDSDPYSLGTCPACGSSLRFNVSGFTDWPADVVGTSAAQEQLRTWVRAQGAVPRLFALCIGTSNHVHSMLHEARAVKAARASLGIDTVIIVVNPDPAAAAAVGDCRFVCSNAADLFRREATE